MNSSLQDGAEKRYVHSHRIFAADAGAHYGKTTQVAPLLELAELGAWASILSGPVHQQNR